MANLECSCGEVIPLGVIPNPAGWYLISELELADFSDDAPLRELHPHMKAMIRCPRCGRLYIYWNGDNSEPVVYAPEPEGKKGKLQTMIDRLNQP
jgi:hypothetical protein